MEAYQQKVRDLVLDAYEQKLPTAEIARRFRVSRLWCRRLDLGTPASLLAHGRMVRDHLINPSDETRLSTSCGRSR